MKGMQHELGLQGPCFDHTKGPAALFEITTGVRQ